MVRTALEALRAGADPIVVEALDIVTHDSLFIHVKLARALDGRDRFATGDEGEDDLVQNDWNGSAKIALISIDRSLNAWHAIAEAADLEAVSIAG